MVLVGRLVFSATLCPRQRVGADEWFTIVVYNLEQIQDCPHNPKMLTPAV